MYLVLIKLSVYNILRKCPLMQNLHVQTLIRIQNFGKNSLINYVIWRGLCKAYMFPAIYIYNTGMLL